MAWLKIPLINSIKTVKNKLYSYQLGADLNQKTAEWITITERYFVEWKLEKNIFIVFFFKNRPKPIFVFKSNQSKIIPRNLNISRLKMERQTKNLGILFSACLICFLSSCTLSTYEISVGYGHSKPCNEASCEQSKLRRLVQWNDVSLNGRWYTLA